MPDGMRRDTRRPTEDDRSKLRASRDHGRRGARVTRTCLAAVIALLLCPLALAAPAGARETGTPTNGTPPSVSGNAIEGGKLKAARGSWSGGTPLRYSVAWSRCTAAGTECKPISGAIKAGYKAVLADVGHRLTATIKATTKEGAGEATSAPSAVIAPAPPKKRKVATISGEAVDGRVLTVGEGTWKGTTPFSFTYQWMRCNGRSCEAIAGATEKSYRAQSADIGRKLRAIVTAHNGAGPASARSKPSAKVAPGSPLNLAPPTIEGTVLPGQTLTAHNGTWVGTPPIAYTYQWLSCSSLGGGCTEIVGATEQTYQVKAEQIGDAFEVVVTATNAEGKASATSAETSITGGGVSAPEDLLPPTVLGLPITGQELTATEGTWKGTEPSYAFQWEVCNASGGACEEIVGATTSKYTIPNGDAGRTLRVTVTASNSAGTASASSSATSEILGVAPVNSELPTISGEAKEGALLTAGSGKWTGTEPIVYEYEWLRCNSSGVECTTAEAMAL